MIKIAKNWAMGNDGICVTLFKRRVIKTGDRKGKEDWHAVRYYNNYVEAARGLVDMDISACSSFELMLDRLNELRDWIGTALPELPLPTPK